MERTDDLKKLPCCWTASDCLWSAWRSQCSPLDQPPCAVAEDSQARRTPLTDVMAERRRLEALWGEPSGAHVGKKPRHQLRHTPGLFRVGRPSAHCLATSLGMGREAPVLHEVRQALGHRQHPRAHRQAGGYVVAQLRRCFSHPPQSVSELLQEG